MSRSEGEVSWKGVVVGNTLPVRLTGTNTRRLVLRP